VDRIRAVSRVKAEALNTRGGGVGIAGTCILQVIDRLDHRNSALSNRSFGLAAFASFPSEPRRLTRDGPSGSFCFTANVTSEKWV
jgi:hypothetical protein